MTDLKRVRFGGLETPDGFLFELTGGNLALDLANTLVSRGSAAPHELLREYADLINWSGQTGLVDPSAATALLDQAGRSPRQAARVLDRAIELREVLHATLAGANHHDVSLEKLQAYAEQVSLNRQLSHEADSIVWRWKQVGLDWMFWPIVEAATTLLTSEDCSRIRICAAASCGWLFLDNSRRRNRRWCDMSVCGNRAKARRHYAKVSAGN